MRARTLSRGRQDIVFRMYGLPAGTHPATAAMYARRELRRLPAPEYVDSVTGFTRPGKWSDVAQRGQRTRYGLASHDYVAYDFDAVVIPA